MSDRKNEARWNESAHRFEITVTGDNGQRKKLVGPVGDNSRKAKIAAERNADKWLLSQLQGESLLVDTLFQRFLDKLKSTSEGNYRQNVAYYNAWIKPSIGNKRVGKLTEQDYQDIIDLAAVPQTPAQIEKNKEMHKQAKTNGRPKVGALSEKSLKNLRGILVQFAKFARKNKASTLIFEGLTIPRNARESDRRAMQPNEIQKLFASDMSTYYSRPVKDWYINLYRFAAASGIRPGELIGLKWSDIEDRKITIGRAYDFYGNETPGKNKNAQRTFTMTEEARNVLDAQQEQLKRVRTDWAFPDKEGDRSLQRIVLDALKRYCKANGIDDLATYELRHTYVSINKEMPPALLKLQVGHSEAMDTQGTYGHELSGDADKAASYADAALRKILSNDK